MKRPPTKQSALASLASQKVFTFFPLLGSPKRVERRSEASRSQHHDGPHHLNDSRHKNR